MRVISHRGAKGYGDENSLDTIKQAAELKVDYIEFDIQYTSNNVVIVLHSRVTRKGTIVSENSFKTIQREISYVPTLRDALKACGKRPAIIESKSKGAIAKSIDIINNYPKSTIASFLPEEILSARINLPKHKTFLLQYRHPFGIIKKSKKVNASGFGINKNYALLLPYYYYMAKKNNLEIYTYTLNVIWVGKLFGKLLPKMYICTDYPEPMLGKE